MHAIKMQTEIGREISETGIVPEFVYLGQVWDGDKPLFEDVDIDLDELPDGTVLRVTYTTFDRNPWYFRKEPSNTGEPWVKLDRDTGSYVVTLGKKLDKRWHRHGDGAVIDADQIRMWATRITVVRQPS